ncbi:unnamed protein product [Schistosoma haematobium]|nr:unnamed protein product [Schistosoma haematobium]CAH8637288.1 unnamed protein product [Schistosoma haematobium]
MNNYTGQYGYMFPMQPNYTWGPNQVHTPVQEPQYTYGYDSTNQQPPPYTDYMGPQVQDYESPVNDFNGQYGYSTNSTPTQPAYSAQWSGNQFQTPSHDSSYWYHSREPPINSQPRYQPPPSTPILEQNRKPKLRIYCKYCDVAFTDEHTYSIHLDTERHIRNFKRSFNTTEDRRGKGKSRSDYRRSNKKAPRRTDYCDVCEQTFQNGRHFYAHLKWKKHKRLCRVARLLRGQLKKTPEEVANDPLGSFTLYMNKDCSVPYGNYGDCKEVELDAGNAFLQKFLDLKHLISQEPNPVGEEFIQEQVYNTRDLEYSCSLCKADLIGADDIENHLRTLTHQKKYKEKFNLEEFAFEEEMRLSASDSVFAVWKTCQSRASKELARIIGEKGFHLCVCGFRITCYDDMRKHFPIKYYDIHPRIRSWKKSLEKCIRSRADRHRIDYRDCYTILTLFGLPSHIIDMKREHALETAKAKLLEDSTKEESATDARGDGEDEDEEENDDEEEEEEERKSVKEDEPPKDPISNAECVEDTHAESS